MKQRCLPQFFMRLIFLHIIINYPKRKEEEYGKECIQDLQ